MAVTYRTTNERFRNVRLRTTFAQTMSRPKVFAANINRPFLQQGVASTMRLIGRRSIYGMVARAVLRATQSRSIDSNTVNNGGGWKFQTTQVGVNENRYGWGFRKRDPSGGNETATADFVTTENPYYTEFRVEHNAPDYQEIYDGLTQFRDGIRQKFPYYITIPPGQPAPVFSPSYLPGPTSQPYRHPRTRPRARPYDKPLEFELIAAGPSRRLAFDSVPTRTGQGRGGRESKAQMTTRAGFQIAFALNEALSESLDYAEIIADNSGFEPGRRLAELPQYLFAEGGLTQIDWDQLVKDLAYNELEDAVAGRLRKRLTESIKKLQGFGPDLTGWGFALS